MEGKQKPINKAQIYPQPVSADKQQAIAPMALAELEIMKVEAAKSVANKNPEIRNIALLLIVVLGVNLLGQIATYLIVRSFDTQTNFFSLFLSSNGVLGIAALLVQLIAIFILLSTRKTSHAKIVLLVASLCFGIALVNGIVSFQISPTMIANVAILAVNFFILRKILKVYLEL